MPLWSVSSQNNDIRVFSEAAQDKHAAHLAPDNHKTFYKSDIVYGIFTSSMFTMIIRDLFPGAIYLDQNLKFTAPVVIDENIKAKIVVKDIKESKKIVTFQTTITKPGEDEKVAVDGSGNFIIPSLLVQEMELAQEDSKDEEQKIKQIQGKSFEEFPRITTKSITDLKNRGINYLFPVQASTFDLIYEK